MTQFVCVWDLSGFYTDDDGEEWNSSDFFGYTFHDTLEEAQEVAQKGCKGYALHMDLIDSEDDEYWKPIFVDEILEYQDNELLGKHSRNDFDGWRFYPVMEHWNEYWPHFMHYPPQTIVENNCN
jgi:hypothetical protein